MKSNNVDISIIVPIYNTEKYLKKCIDSLINQTKEEIEIVLINDGSKGNCDEIIGNYSDKRIKYYKNKNQGIGKTRNFGIENSIGKYLMFIDSDDYIKEDCCEKMFKNAIQNNSDIVVSDFYKDINGDLHVIRVDDFLPSSLKENPNLLLTVNPGPCNKIYKRSLITNNKIKFDEEHKYEDSPFVIDSLIRANKISKENEALSYYCIHNNSETTVRDEKVFDIIYIVNKIRENTKKFDYLKEQIDILTVDILMNYTIQQRFQKNKKISNGFINAVFDYLEKEVPNYRDKKFYGRKHYLRRKIESNRLLTKYYCNIARVKYGRR